MYERFRFLCLYMPLVFSWIHVVCMFYDLHGQSIFCFVLFLSLRSGRWFSRTRIWVPDLGPPVAHVRRNLKRHACVVHTYVPAIYLLDESTQAKSTNRWGRPEDFSHTTFLATKKNSQKLRHFAYPAFRLDTKALSSSLTAPLVGGLRA